MFKVLNENYKQNKQINTWGIVAFPPNRKKSLQKHDFKQRIKINKTIRKGV